jgi:exonuclease VII large subunit
MGRLPRGHHERLQAQGGSSLPSQALEKLIADPHTAHYLLALFDQHKRRLLKELSDKFKRLRDTLKRLEESASRQLEEVTARKEQQVRGLFGLEGAVAAEYQEWEDRSFGLIIQTEECTLEEKLKNLYDYNTTRLLTQGEAILDKIRHHEQNIPNAF